ncbi:MAG: hypothetical protein K8T10_18795 [Candidatus Eremiobacteraeota bacterium]|nr:hypothetical protein [Candidatus Eremiobacteraeota bacterium]
MRKAGIGLLGKMRSFTSKEMRKKGKGNMDNGGQKSVVEVFRPPKNRGWIPFQFTTKTRRENEEFYL